MTAGYAVDGTRQDHPEDGQRAAAEETTAGLVRVVVQPAGRRVDVPAGTSVLAAVRAAGMEVVSVCGGRGLCGTCRVLSGGGGLTPPTEPERELLAPAELSAGVRLACQAAVAADTRVDVPPESLTTPQRLVFEGRAASVTALDPAVVALDVQVSPPAIDDLRSDATRLQDAVTAAGQPVARTGLAVLSTASVTLRSRSWAARAAVHRSETGEGGEIIALLPEGTVPLGAAIDVGTTKLAAYLVNLETGETVAKGAAPNPQVAIGEDVMSRIAYGDAHERGACGLHEQLADGINRLLAELRDRIRASSWQLVDAVAVGNTAMHHLLVNLPVRQLGRAPYVPAVTQLLTLRATDIGLELAPGAKIYLPPNIAGFVGADHVAALLAAGAAEDGRTALVLDIGTNTEISVTSGGQLWACSCASGPAFRGGAHPRRHARGDRGDRARELPGRRLPGTHHRRRRAGRHPRLGHPRRGCGGARGRDRQPARPPLPGTPARHQVRRRACLRSGPGRADRTRPGHPARRAPTSGRYSSPRPPSGRASSCCSPPLTWTQPRSTRLSLPGRSEPTLISPAPSPSGCCPRCRPGASGR